MMDNLPDDIMQEGPIQMLNIDTLLVIFNILSLYDKLMAMRVNKKWHQIISTHHAWNVIDFTEKGPCEKVETSTEKNCRWFLEKNGPHVFEFRERGSKWTFPKTEVLRFLSRHAGLSLQELYVYGAIHRPLLNDEVSKFDSEAIIKYLLINCPNIKALALRLSTVCRQLPQNLVSLKLTYDLRSSNIPETFSSNHIISCISKCQHLQNLSLHMELFYDGMKMLSEITQLQKLELYISAHTSAVLIANFESTIGKMVFLQHFRLSGVMPWPPRNSVDHVLQSIARWTNLKSLSLVNLIYTSKAFEIMISQLLNLEKLKLTRRSVTSSVVQLIGTHLKKLKLLELLRGGQTAETSEVCEIMVAQLLNLETLRLAGDYLTSSVVQMIGTQLKKLTSLELTWGAYTAEGLQSLSHHPMLEHLVVMEEYKHDKMNEIERRKWVVDVYKVLLTLPKIRKIQVIFNNFDFQFPEINYVINSAEIKLVNRNDRQMLIHVGSTCTI